jgi:DNA-binding transcriptional ArsR family regulator
VTRADVVFAAVSNPERRRILDMLREGDRTAGALVAEFTLPQPAISRHLRILREAGLVSVSPKAQQRIYSLKPERLRELDSWLSLYRGLWSGSLGSLEDHLGHKSKEEERATP